jgi:acyl-CoA dehydrogenase
MALPMLDRAMQIHGAAGLSQDLPLAGIFAGMGALSIGDGPEEVHREAIKVRRGSRNRW